MRTEIIISLVIASYGAILSTSIFIRTVLKERIKINVDIFFAENGTVNIRSSKFDKNPRIILSITNSSMQSVKLSNHALIFSQGNKKENLGLSLESIEFEPAEYNSVQFTMEEMFETTIFDFIRSLDFDLNNDIEITSSISFILKNKKFYSKRKLVVNFLTREIR